MRAEVERLGAMLSFIEKAGWIVGTFAGNSSMHLTRGIQCGSVALGFRELISKAMSHSEPYCENGIWTQLQAKEQELADLRAFKVSLMNTLHTFSTAEGDILAAARSLESRIADRDETIRHLKQVPPPKPDAPVEQLSSDEVYERREDMSPDGKLQIFLQNDGDVIVQVIGYRHDQLELASVEFCSCGSGGGRSPKTRAALLELARAIAEDNRTKPFPPAEPKPDSPDDGEGLR